MRLPEPFCEIEDQIVIDLPGARAVFTTRRGGHSAGPYSSLNLGLLTDDDPAVVQRNRVTLRDALGVPPLSYVHQVHGAEVLPADSARDGGAPVGLAKADGQVTDQPGVAMVALTADCLPVAIAGDRALGMVHAGWRGLAGGVLAAAVTALSELGAEPLAAAIGPGAGGCCYQAGAEVHAAFAGVRGARRGDNADLKAVARHQLTAAGVPVVHDVDLCTICADPGLFFSHRRDHGITGRQAGVAWRSD
jgi:YfiH family protein